MTTISQRLSFSNQTLSSRGGNTLVHGAAAPHRILFYMCLCVLRALKRTQNTQTHVEQLSVAFGDQSVRQYCPNSFEAPGPVVERPAGSVEITEIDGGVSQGTVHIISVNVRPMEIQILGK